MPAKIDSRVAVNEMKSAGYKPLKLYLNSKHPWKCKHLKCGEIITPTYNQIQQGWRGCIHCSGEYVDPTKAEKQMIAAGMIPQEPYPGKDKPWKCICTRCNKVINSTYVGVYPKFVDVRPHHAELVSITVSREPSGIAYVAPVMVSDGPRRSGKPRPRSDQRRKRHR